MKKIKNTIYLLPILIVILVGCSESNSGFLDADTSSNLNRETVFGDSIMTYEFQARVYNHLKSTYFADNEMNQGGYWSWSDLSGDSKNKWAGTAQIAHRFNTNTITDPNESRFKRHWTNCYQGISRSNIFIENIELAPLHDKTKARLKAEVRLARSWLYFHLLRLYGGVPLVGDKVFGIKDKVDTPRATFKEIVDYIVAECDELARLLPEKQTGREYGRMTSGMALAIKARVLLFAASPLSNGNLPESEEDMKVLIGYPEQDMNLWKLAADAAKAVIDLGTYELYYNDESPGKGFYQMQVTRVNKEIIFPMMKGRNRFNEIYLLPNSRGGQVYASPFQELVDAFAMNNGLPISDPNSGYDPKKPYENRDPRFYYTILYDGSMWIPKSGSQTKERINFYWGAPDDGLSVGVTKTGYAFRKFCNEEVSGSSGGNDNVLPFIRLAEMYLNYAEAMNEFNPSNKAEVEKYLILLRERAGILPGTNNRYGLPLNYTQEEMRQIIRNERRVEFAIEEGHRFFDLKRWGKLEEAKNGVEFHAIQISNPASGPQTYTNVMVEKHIFDAKRQYYFPIPPSEINIVGIDLLKQNPGW